MVVLRPGSTANPAALRMPGGCSGHGTLTHILHEGGLTMTTSRHALHNVRVILRRVMGRHVVLIGFPKNLALQLARCPLSHSDGYGSAADRPICLARFPGNPDPLVHYAG